MPFIKIPQNIFFIANFFSPYLAETNERFVDFLDDLYLEFENQKFSNFI
jgi:hypothetical protein